MTGRFALAAIPSAKTDKKATFNFWATSARRIDTMATATEEIRATIICFLSVIFPFLMICP